MGSVLKITEERKILGYLGYQLSIKFGKHWATFSKTHLVTLVAVAVAVARSARFLGLS
jgi:hypothetical protein